MMLKIAPVTAVIINLFYPSLHSSLNHINLLSVVTDSLYFFFCDDNEM